MDEDRQVAPEASDDEEFGENAVAQLDTLDAAPFSDKAYSVLRGYVQEYIRDLIRHSNDVARRNRADSISASHVERANEFLVSGVTKRWLKLLGTVGGIALGAGASTFVGMVLSSSFTGAGVLVAGLLTTVGMGLVAWQMSSE